MRTPNQQDLRGLLNGDWLRSPMVRQQYKLIGMVSALFFVYIFVGYLSMRQQRILSETKQQVLDAKYEYMTVSARLVDMSRPSQVAAALQARGSKLRENQQPPIKIEP